MFFILRSPKTNCFHRFSNKQAKIFYCFSLFDLPKPMVFIGFQAKKQNGHRFPLFDLPKPVVFISFQTQKQNCHRFPLFDLPKPMSVVISPQNYFRPFSSDVKSSSHQVIEFARGPAAEGEALKIRRPLAGAWHVLDLSSKVNFKKGPMVSPSAAGPFKFKKTSFKMHYLRPCIWCSQNHH